MRPNRGKKPTGRKPPSHPSHRLSRRAPGHTRAAAASRPQTPAAPPWRSGSRGSRPPIFRHLHEYGQPLRTAATSNNRALAAIGQLGEELLQQTRFADAGLASDCENQAAAFFHALIRAPQLFPLRVAAHSRPSGRRKGQDGERRTWRGLRGLQRRRIERRGRIGRAAGRNQRPKIRDQRLRRLVTLAEVPLDQFLKDADQGRGRIGPVTADALRFAIHQGVHESAKVVALEGQVSGQNLEKRDPQRPKVGAFVHGAARGLFGGKVCGRSDDGSILVSSWASVTLARPKSRIFTRPSAMSIRLEHLMSRCTIPALCAALSASAACNMYPAASAGDGGQFCGGWSMRPRKVLPGMYSSTRKGMFSYSSIEEIA